MSFELEPLPRAERPRSEPSPPLQERSWEGGLMLIGLLGFVLFLIIHWK